MKLVLLCFGDHARAGGGSSYPSIPRVARETGLNRRTVQRIVAELIAGGYLRQERPATGTRPAHYRVCTPAAFDRGDNAPPAVRNPGSRGGAPPDPSRDPSILSEAASEISDRKLELVRPPVGPNPSDVVQRVRKHLDAIGAPPLLPRQATELERRTEELLAAGWSFDQVVAAAREASARGKIFALAEIGLEVDNRSRRRREARPAGAFSTIQETMRIVDQLLPDRGDS